MTAITSTSIGHIPTFAGKPKKGAGNRQPLNGRIPADNFKQLGNTTKPVGSLHFWGNPGPQEAVREIQYYLNQWKSGLDIPEAYRKLIPDFEFPTPELAQQMTNMAGGYNSTLNRMFITNAGIREPENFPEIAAHEGNHALANVRRQHLFIQDPERFKQEIRNAVLDRITSGEEMPMVIIGDDSGLPKHLQPQFNVPAQYHHRFEFLMSKLIGDLFKQEDLIDHQKKALSPKGKASLDRILQPELRTVLEEAAPHQTIEESVNQLLRYVLLLPQSASVHLMEVPPFPNDFRPQLRTLLERMLEKPDVYFQANDWERDQLTEQGKEEFLKLLDSPEGQEFTKFYESSADAKADLLNYGLSIFSRVRMAELHSKIQFNPSEAEALQQLPLTDDLRREAIAATRGFISTLEGNKLSEEAAKTKNPQLLLGYFLTATEELQSRTASYKFLRENIQKEIQLFIQPGLNATAPGITNRLLTLRELDTQLTRSLELIEVLGEYGQLMREINLAEKNPVILHQVSRLTKQQEALLGELNQGPEPRISNEQQRQELRTIAREIQQLTTPKNLLKETTANQELQEKLTATQQRFISLYPQCNPVLKDELAFLYRMLAPRRVEIKPQSRAFPA